ncbi:hypothetical protein MMPV_009861 [Pyropia vietnamensis]
MANEAAMLACGIAGALLIRDTTTGYLCYAEAALEVEELASDIGRHLSVPSTLVREELAVPKQNGLRGLTTVPTSNYQVQPMTALKYDGRLGRALESGRLGGEQE